MNMKKNHPNSKAKNGKKKTYKFIKKGKGNEPTVIEFNLSKAVIILIAIGVIIATIATVKVISTIVGAKENNVLADNEETNVTWVESTHVDESGATVVDVDEDGNPIKVPVPKGYSASKVPGETSANSGFVIYEGDIDWSTILVDTTSQNSIDTQANTNTETNTNETTTQSRIAITEDGELQIPNKEYFNFPSSGSLGSNVFYKIGIAVIVLGVVILFLRKRVIIVKK